MSAFTLVQRIHISISLKNSCCPKLQHCDILWGIKHIGSEEFWAKWETFSISNLKGLIQGVTNNAMLKVGIVVKKFNDLFQGTPGFKKKVYLCRYTFVEQSYLASVFTDQDGKCFALRCKISVSAVFIMMASLWVFYYVYKILTLLISSFFSYSLVGSHFISKMWWC